jgi:hypothetical protein
MAEEQQSQQKEAGLDGQVDEDYAVWRKNTPFLYDLVISHPLEWPSLTVHWAPIPAPLPLASDPSLAVHRLVLGTHTAGGSPNFLMVADALLPREASEASVDGNAENPIVPKVSFWFLVLPLIFEKDFVVFSIFFSWIVRWMLGILMSSFVGTKCLLKYLGECV